MRIGKNIRHKDDKMNSLYQINAIAIIILSEFNKVEKILKGSLVLILSPSTSVKIQIMGRKVCLWCKGKTLLQIVNKLLKKKVC